MNPLDIFYSTNSSRVEYASRVWLVAVHFDEVLKFTKAAFEMAWRSELSAR